jgi:hypothetical protein
VATSSEPPSVVPQPANPYLITVISPTYPPKLRGIWDPLKKAEEDFARGPQSEHEH